MLIEKYNASVVKADFVRARIMLDNNWITYSLWWFLMQEGNGPVHIAAFGGYEDLVDLLCQKYGVDPTAKNKVNRR